MRTDLSLVLDDGLPQAVHVPQHRVVRYAPVLQGIRIAVPPIVAEPAKQTIGTPKTSAVGRAAKRRAATLCALLQHGWNAQATGGGLRL